MNMVATESDNQNKKMKLDNKNGTVDNKEVAAPQVAPVISDMSHYSITELLGQSDDGRTVFTRGHIAGKEGDTVVLFETNSIDLDKVKLFLSSESGVKLSMSNDIFNILHVDPPPGTNSIKTTVIHPATTKLINKYRQRPAYFVTETPEMYERVTRPYIMDHLKDHKWVYNVLEGKAEQDRLVCQDPDPEQGFMLVADLKWDMTTTENLYCLAIIQRRDIYSVRDLNTSHLPMLRNLQETCLAAIKEKFGVPSSLLRVYFHYQPAYYHLHVHFAHIRYQVGAPIIGKSLAYGDVLQNIELCGEYYQKATLRYYIKDGHALSNELDKHGIIVRE